MNDLSIIKREYGIEPLKGIFAAIASFWKSLFRKEEKTDEVSRREPPDVDEVARNFYRTLMEAEKDRKN